MSCRYRPGQQVAPAARRCSGKQRTNGGGKPSYAGISRYASGFFATAASLGLPFRICIVPMRVQNMPVMSDDRDGAQTGDVANALSKTTPSRASRSRLGVGTVRSP
jgi:hypothetical protein